MKKADRIMKAPFGFLVLLLIWSAFSCSIVDEHDPDQYDNVDPDSVLLLTPGEALLPADGISTLTLAAKLVPPHPDIKTITFSTNAGTLIGAKDGKLEVVVNENREASVRLQSSQKQETALVRATIAGVIREAKVTFTRVSEDDILILTPRLAGTVLGEGAAVPADKATIISLDAQLGTSAGSMSQKITFSASTGNFTPVGTKTVELLTNSEGFVGALLRVSNQPGPLYLQAGVGDFVRRTKLVLAPIGPDEIVVDAGAFALEADSTFSKTTHVKGLLKHGLNGVASAGTGVIFTLLDQEGGVLSGFRLPTDGFRDVTKVDENGVVSATLSVGGTSYRGLATIYVTSTDREGSTVRGSDTIRIVDPAK